MFTRMDKTFDLVISYCLQKGVFRGQEEYISFTNTYITALQHASDNVCSRLVNVSDKKSTTKIKRHCCLFCKKLITQLTRHFKLVHPGEVEVQQALLMTDKAQRDDAWSTLRLRGDAKYNLTCPASEKIFVRNPVLQDRVQGILCSHCKGMFAKREFSRHQRKCSNRIANRQHVTKLAKRQQQAEEQQQKQQSGPSLQHGHEQRGVQNMQKQLRNQWLRDLYDQMTDDHIKRLIETDRCLVLLAGNLSCKFANSTNYNTAKQHLRLCGRLLNALRHLRPDLQSFEDALTPGNYEVLMDAIYEVAGSDHNSPGVLLKPSTAVLFNHLITKLISCLYRYYMKSRSDTCDYSSNMLTLKHLRKIHTEEFNVYISKKARKTIVNKQITKKHVIPSLEDTKKFADYIRERSDWGELKLLEGFDYTAWCALGKCLLLQLLVFNRRRTTEVCEIRLESFYKRESISTEQQKCMTLMQRALAAEFSVITIVAKRNRKVPILINNNQVK